MEKLNRKITWVHVTYERNNQVSVVWSTQRWRDGEWLGTRRREFIFSMNNWSRLERLLHQARYSKWLRYTLPAYNGWSVCFEIEPSYMLV